MRNRIRFFRKRYGMDGLTQIELAKLVGTNQANISTYERGERPIPRRRMMKIAEILKQKLERIFPDELKYQD